MLEVWLSEWCLKKTLEWFNNLAKMSNVSSYFCYKTKTSPHKTIYRRSHSFNSLLHYGLHFIRLQVFNDVSHHCTKIKCTLWFIYQFLKQDSKNSQSTIQSNASNPERNKSVNIDVSKTETFELTRLVVGYHVLLFFRILKA